MAGQMLNLMFVGSCLEIQSHTDRVYVYYIKTQTNNLYIISVIMCNYITTIYVAYFF